MDDKLLSIKAIEQKIVDYLHVYKKCKTVEEKQEVQQIIQRLESILAGIRK
jgi:hypothetical protein